MDRHRVETFGLISGFYSRHVLQNKVKNLFCHFSLIFVFTPADMQFMKTCRLSASSFKVLPEAFCELLLAYFDVKVASLMLRKFILRSCKKERI